MNPVSPEGAPRGGFVSAGISANTGLPRRASEWPGAGALPKSHDLIIFIVRVRTHGSCIFQQSRNIQNRMKNESYQDICASVRSDLSCQKERPAGCLSVRSVKSFNHTFPLGIKNSRERGTTETVQRRRNGKKSIFI